MSHVRLIHWNAAEAEKRAVEIRSAGYEVAYEPLTPTALRELKKDPPIAVVIDLARLPMQGRDVATALRLYKTTRDVPLVFVDGDPGKVAGIKEVLPDAVYSTWDKIQNSLRRAIAYPPTDPVVPRSLFDVYEDTILVKKLGIRPNSVVALVNAPEGFERPLGELPDDVTLRRRTEGGRDLTIWFIRSREELEGHIERMVPMAERGGLWIVWPKKASEMAPDLSQRVVREVGIAAGLVDYKVCSVDATWSGLRFSQRKSH